MLVDIVLDSMVDTLDEWHMWSCPTVRKEALLRPNLKKSTKCRIAKEVVHGSDNTVLTQEAVDIFQ